MIAENSLLEATEKSNEIINKLQNEWRNQPENKKLMEKFHENVTYSFTKDGSPLPLDTQTKDDTSGKFVYIDIRIPEDIALADEIITNINAEIGGFVISNTTPVEKNDAIKCISLTTGDAKDLNEDSLLKNIILFALIFFAAFELLACACIVVTHFKKTVFADEAVTKTEGSANEANE